MLNLTQVTLLMVVAFAGIPAGFFIARNTKEEMKPGKKWFQIIAAASIVVIIPSLIALEGDAQALALSTSSFIFFISAVPLYSMKKKI